MKFIRHAAHRKTRVGTRWRKPRGLHNKMRDQKKGARPLLKEGYRSAKTSRNKKNGLEVVTVYNTDQIAALDPKEHGVVIGAVGGKKKLELLDAVEKAKLTLLTGKVEDARKAIIDKFNERSKERESKQKERESKQKEREEQAKKKDKKQEKESEDKPEAESVKKAPAKKSAKKAEKSEEESTEKSKEDLEKDKVLTKAR